MIVVLDASTLVSAALKADSVPERALLRAVKEPNRLVLSQAVEDEYREVIYRPKFDRYVSRAHRQNILNIVVAAAGGADVIISSDVHHLLSMHPWRGIAIVSPADYLALP